MINRHLHLQHHRHSGSALHHRHTSYRAIVSVLIVAGIFMIWLAYYSNSKSSFFGTLPAYEAPAPDSIPFISTPAVNSSVESDEAEVGGTCAKNIQNYVIVRNANKITGSTVCSSDGRFSISQPIIFGTNVFTASSVNVSGKETALTIGVGISGASGSLVNAVTVSSDVGTVQYSPKQEFSLPLNLEGGSQPYKVAVDWGDGNKQQLETRDAKISPKHTYQSKGDHKVVVTVEGNKSSSQSYSFVAVDIKGYKPSKTTAVASTGVSSGSGSTPQGFITVFSFGLYALALVVVIPFVRSSKYAPEIIDSDNDKLFEE